MEIFTLDHQLIIRQAEELNSVDQIQVKRHLSTLLNWHQDRLPISWNHFVLQLAVQL